MTLLDETLRLLKARQVTIEVIHRDTGLPFYWLRKMAGGEIPNPGVQRVQVLYEYLSKKKLFVG